MKVKKANLIFYTLTTLIASIFAIFMSSIPLLFCVIMYLFVGAFTETKSNVHMMFFLGFTTFFFLPAILNWYYLDTSFEYFYISAIIAIFFLYITRNTKIKEFINFGSAIKYIFFMLSALMVVGISLKLDRAVASLFVFYIIMLSLSFEQNRIISNSIYILIFLTVYIFYAGFLWSGGGRTVIMGWLLLALLQYAYSINYKINKYIFALLPAFAAALLANRDIFKLEFSGFRHSLNDSAYYPYQLASTFIDHYQSHGLDWYGFIDQVIFSLFIFIPRSVWQDKPYGFGFEYTVQNLDQSLIDAGHSMAATLIGEHIYYLGYLGIISSLFTFALIGILTNRLYNIKELNGNGIILFSSSMMALVWGGMSSFAARIIIPSIVFIIFFLLFRRLFRKKTRIAFRSEVK